MNVLVTGGAGFIGSHIVEFHLNNHDKVHVIDDLSTGSQDNINLFKDNPDFSFTNADLCDVPDFEKIVGWADRIYHMAAVVGVLRVIKDHIKLLNTNITQTERLLQIASTSIKKPLVILASTSEVYGDGHAKPLKEGNPLIIGEERKGCVPYAVSKIALESFAHAYNEQFGLPIILIRFFNTIGPRQSSQYGMVVPRFIRSAMNNEPIVIYGTGEQTRSFADVRDVVQLVDKIANNPKSIGEAINVGRDEEISINDLALLIKKITRSKSEIKHISYEEAYGPGFIDIMYRRPDLSKLDGLTKHNYNWNLATTIQDLALKFDTASPLKKAAY